MEDNNSQSSRDEVSKRPHAGTAMAQNIKPLLMTGASSPRTGTPTHLLPHEDGRPLYQHTLEHLITAFPLLKTFYISLRDQTQTAEIDLAGAHKISKHVELIYDSTAVVPLLGPAAGLIAAHIYDPSATWLAVGCCDLCALFDGADVEDVWWRSTCRR